MVFSLCHKPIFHRLKVQALIPCSETIPLLLHHVKFHPWNFSRSAVPKLLIKPVHCIQRGAPWIYNHILISSMLVSCPLLIMPLYLDSFALWREEDVWSAACCLMLPKDLGRAVTLDAREEIDTLNTQSRATPKPINSNTSTERDCPSLSGYLISGTLFACYANTYLAKWW